MKSKDKALLREGLLVGIFLAGILAIAMVDAACGPLNYLFAAVGTLCLGVMAAACAVLGEPPEEDDNG